MNKPQIPLPLEIRQYFVEQGREGARRRWDKVKKDKLDKEKPPVTT